MRSTHRPHGQFSSLTKLAAPALLALGLFAVGSGSASAVTTLTFYDNDTTTARGTVECSLSCQGAMFLADGRTLANPGWSNVSGDVVPKNGGNDLTDQLDFVNDVAGTSFTLADASKTDVSGDTYTSPLLNALYVLLHIGGGQSGNDWILIKNISNALQTITYTKQPRSNGGGISTISTFGAVSVVPLPAGMALGASALGLLGLIGWGRKRGVS